MRERERGSGVVAGSRAIRKFLMHDRKKPARILADALALFRSPFDRMHGDVP